MPAEHRGISIHWQLYCLLNSFLRTISKKTSKLHINGFFFIGIHQWLVDSPHKGASNAECICMTWITLTVYWTPSWWKTRTHISHTDNIMAADDPVIQVAMVSVAKVLTKFSHNIPVSAPKRLTHLSLMPHICVSELGQHWFRLWLVAWSAPSHYLNQY